MSEAKFGLEPYNRKPLHPEQEVPVEYALPFDWGNMYVSEAAHAAYDLTPFVPTISRTEAEKIKHHDKPAYNITLIGPDEDVGFEKKLDSHNGLGAAQTGEVIASSRYNARGVELVLSLTVDANYVQQKAMTDLRQTMAKIHDVDVEVIDEFLEHHDATNMPIELRMGQGASHIVSHSVAYAAGERSRSDLQSWRVAMENKAVFGRARTLAASGFVATSINLVPLFYGVESKENVLAAGFFAVGTTVGVLASFRENISRRPRIEETARLQSFIASKLIHQGVHDAYCQSTFDRQMEERLEA